MSGFGNDNDAPGGTARASGLDAHGEVAILLVESLIHALIERSILSVPDAIAIVEVAVEVTQDTAQDRGEAPRTVQERLAILDAISFSLKTEILDR